MSKTSDRRAGIFARSPISTVNTILVLTFFAASVVLAVLGNVGMALLMAYFGVVGLAVALYARRPDSRDITRLNAIEYRDERDKSLASQGFAAVGVAALIIVFASFIVMMLAQQVDWYVLSVLLALLVVWGVANSVAVRRR
jgi:accessory gene regulator protein AgrB